ncbi:MAG: tetraacyldisaccharide 4'-kinase [Phycisphaerales bacterium]|nr:MAG: tetraacyldisaccharide 4'-kinase [Phycisphaerales bacterium]
MNQDAFRKLISGQRVGLVPTLLRFFLGLAAAGYSAAVRIRNFLYSTGLLKTHRVTTAVLSVGNITAGGTGKTPLVIWLCNFITRDYKCAILTRGYKARSASRVMRRAKDERNTQHDIRYTTDEPAVLAQSCPQVNVVVNPDRVAGAGRAVGEFGANVLIMDDGFQHRRLARDLDIVTIDATNPFGYGKLLPAGLLREPVGALARADAVVITRCDQIDVAELARLETKLREVSPNTTIAKAIHAPVCVKAADGKEKPLEKLNGKKVFAFCGIGNPDSFLSTVRALGCNPVGSKAYDDHHHYTRDCLAETSEQAARLKADMILTTEKDWTKIAALDAAERDIPYLCLVVRIEFIAGEETLKALINETLPGKIPYKKPDMDVGGPDA